MALSAVRVGDYVRVGSIIYKVLNKVTLPYSSPSDYFASLTLERAQNWNYTSTSGGDNDWEADDYPVDELDYPKHLEKDFANFGTVAIFPDDYKNTKPFLDTKNEHCISWFHIPKFMWGGDTFEEMFTKGVCRPSREASTKRAINLEKTKANTECVSKKKYPCSWLLAGG